MHHQVPKWAGNKMMGLKLIDLHRQGPSKDLQKKVSGQNRKTTDASLIKPAHGISYGTVFLYLCTRSILTLQAVLCVRDSMEAESRSMWLVFYIYWCALFSFAPDNLNRCVGISSGFCRCMLTACSSITPLALHNESFFYFLWIVSFSNSVYFSVYLFRTLSMSFWNRIINFLLAAEFLYLFWLWGFS